MILATMIGGLVLAGRTFVRGRLRTWRHPRLGTTRGVDVDRYLDAVAAELRRGASLRHALALPMPESRMARLAMTGQPIELVAAEVGRMLAPHGELAVAGIRLASRTGAPASRVFAGLAERTRSQRQLERDQVALSAQARLSAGVVAVLPLAASVIVLATGRAGFLSQPGPARTAVLAGLGLQIIGLALIMLMLRSQR